MGRPRAFIEGVAKCFDQLGLPRLSLNIGSALSYYGHDDQMSLIDLVLAGFLVPSDGLLIPTVATIRCSTRNGKIPHHGICGQVDLRASVEALVHCVLQQRQPQDSFSNALLVACLQWHVRWGLVDRWLSELHQFNEAEE